ncbi:uncharacterized protein LOC117178374 [Belonocnema kinseyi]|uniref:uncharacterized protein LOC117178374 n=1 Tax=Belonocnema kinseyi TaxID=2817044 RepID=UPI00143D606B|nr:uncharacterized protein LOC117178374 [Belonocnema kinseyi]
MNLNVFPFLVLAGIGGALGNISGGASINAGINFDEEGNVIGDAINKCGGLVQGIGNKLGLVGGLLQGVGQGQKSNNGLGGGYISNGVGANGQVAAESSATNTLIQTGGQIQAPGGYCIGGGSNSGGLVSNGQATAKIEAKNTVIQTGGQVQGPGSDCTVAGSNSGGTSANGQAAAKVIATNAVVPTVVQVQQSKINDIGRPSISVQTGIGRQEAVKAPVLVVSDQMGGIVQDIGSRIGGTVGTILGGFLRGRGEKECKGKEVGSISSGLNTNQGAGKGVVLNMLNQSSSQAQGLGSVNLGTAGSVSGTLKHVGEKGITECKEDQGNKGGNGANVSAAASAAVSGR